MKNMNTPSSPKPPADAKSLPQVPHSASAEAATIIQGVSTAMVLAKCDPHGITKKKGPVAYQFYRNKVLVEAGDSNDPLETMLIEQLMMAHQTIGSLYVRAADSNDPAAINVYTSGAARLMAESRKALMAIREYRTPSGPQQLTIVKQQNLAGGNQQVAFVEKPGETVPAEEKEHDTELVSKPTEVLAHEELPELIAQPAPSRGGTEEPVEARRPILRRRERVRLAALRHCPWKHSTGPRSATGKDQARANGKLRQKGLQSVRELKAELVEVRELITTMSAARRAVANHAVASICAAAE